MSHKIVAVLVISFFLVGCSNSKTSINKTVKIDEKPQYQIPKRVEPPKPKAKGSLYSSQGGSLFSDRKNLQVGDIVYVEISEGPAEATTESTRTTSLNDEARTQAGGSLNNAPESSLNVVGGVLEKSANLLNKVLGMGYTLPSRSGTFTASSESTVEDEFKYNISAVVTQLFQNGNYLIEGTKEVVVSGQKQTLRLSGVLSPYDLESNNKIDSNKLANLKVVYYKDGEDQENMEKPWGSKIVETISPF